MSDIEVFKPKTSPIDVLNNYKFTEEEIKKLECVYTKEWDLYVKGLTQFIDQSILDKVEGIKLCVSKITTGDPDKWIDTNEVFSEAKRQAFVKWLFKSHIMALRDCDRAIGNSIDHHLPILFRIYINEGRYKRLLSKDLPETAKIEDFNKLTQLIIDSLNGAIGPYFELDVVSGVTTEDRFQYIPVNVKMKTIYQESEDTYIKSFLAHLVVERNKQTGLEEFHSVELFGFGKKKMEKIVESLKNVDYMKDINTITNTIKNLDKDNDGYYMLNTRIGRNPIYNNTDILKIVAKNALHNLEPDNTIVADLDIYATPIINPKTELKAHTDDDSEKTYYYKDKVYSMVMDRVSKACKNMNLTHFKFVDIVCVEVGDSDSGDKNGKPLRIVLKYKISMPESNV